MKFINRDYFPEFIKGTEEILPGNGKATRPARTFVGFGLDSKAPNGAVVAGELGTAWGLSFAYQKGVRWVDGAEFTEEPPRYVAGGVSGKFRYVCHGELTVSMVKYSKNAVVFSLSSLKKLRIRLSFYSLTPYDTSFRRSGNRMLGIARERSVIFGDKEVFDNDEMFKGRYEVINDDISAKNEYAVASVAVGAIGDYEVKDDRVLYECVLDEHNPRVVVYMAVGGEGLDEDLPSQDELIKGVNNAELYYAAHKVSGSGTLCEGAGEIVANVLSNKIYNPLRLNTYYIEDRNKVDGNYNFDPTDAAVAGLCSTLIGDTSFEQLALYAEDAIMGAFSVWTAFCRTRNNELLKAVYPKWKKKWSADGKLITADPITKREIAYKMPSSPIKDIKAQLLYPLDYNTYKLIALEIMEKTARIIAPEDAKKLNDAVLTFRHNFFTTFFNKKTGIFADRYATGEFSECYGCLSFLPLVTGAVSDNETLELMLINLRDKNKLWNEIPVPSISIDHYSYGKKMRRIDGSLRNPYEDYTGSTIPYINYFIYLGLVKAGAVDAAGSFAELSAKAWRKYFKRFRSVPSLFLPNFRLDSKASLNSVSGNLFGLIGITELLDAEYFREDLRPAIRFGTMVEGDQRISNYKLFGNNFGVTKAAGVTTLYRNGKAVIEGSGGAFTVRNLIENEDGIEFMTYARAPITFTVDLPILLARPVGGDIYRFNVEEGKHLVVIKNRRVRVTAIYR